MPISPMYKEVAVIALRAAGRYEFALGGVNALNAHELTSRGTIGVDLVTSKPGAVRVAAPRVAAALVREGFTLQPFDTVSTLREMCPGRADQLVVWLFITPDGRRARLLRLACARRSLDPVTLDDIGPVLHPEDAAGATVCSLVLRRWPDGREWGRVRDYMDVAAMLGRWSPAQLAGFGRRIHRGVNPWYLADVARRLDEWSGEKFMWPDVLTSDQVAALREQWADWPRDHRAWQDLT